MGDADDRKVFTAITELDDKNIVKIVGASDHTFALDENGKVWGTGANRFDGALGIGQKGVNVFHFTQAVGAIDDVKIIDVSGSFDGTLALDEDGYIWGAGNTSTIGCTTSVSVTSPMVFVKVHDPHGKKIVKISAGGLHSLALDEDGGLYTTGSSDNGSGTGNIRADSFIKLNNVTGDENLKFVDISTYRWHSLALDENGRIWATGENEYGQLGLGDTDDRDVFVQVTEGAIKDKKIVAIAAGYHHSVALDSDGKIWTTGDGYYASSGYLGRGENPGSTTFQQVTMGSIGSEKIKAIYAGSLHSAALDSNDVLWVAGNNTVGQIGLGALYNASVFTKVRR